MSDPDVPPVSSSASPDVSVDASERSASVAPPPRGGTPRPHPEQWATRLGVILAVTGSAVGLGNFLRFPGLAAKYEGGAFMIPYFLSFLLLGLPLAWAEWALGRYGGVRGFNSAAGIYRTIWRNRLAPFFGVLAMLVPVGIYMFYVVIEAWCLAYAWYMLTGRLSLGRGNTEAYAGFFNDFVGIGQDGFLFGVGGDATLVFVAICFTLNFLLIYRGLTRGIEWFCRWAMPALAVCAVLVLIRVLTLGTPDPAFADRNVAGGLGFMWNLRTEQASFWQSLANAEMWLAAAGQIFFSLSVGFGVIVNYASYVGRHDDIALSGLTSAAGNEFCEVGLGGLITIPAAFVFLGAVGTAAVAGSSFNLGFVTLPMVFEMMPLGRVVGTLFFTLLFLAAVTSSVSMLQPAIALLEEGLGLNRRSSVALLGFMTLIGAGFVLYFSQGLRVLDTLDFWVGTFGIYILATFQIILFGWVLGVERGYAEISRGAEVRVPWLFMGIIKYVSPTFLLIVFAAFVYQQLTARGEDNRFLAVVRDPVVALTVGLIVAVSAVFAVFIAQAVRRWDEAEASTRHSQAEGLIAKEGVRR